MCTVIYVGPQASDDGSSWLTHSDAGQDSRIRRVPAADHAPGSMAGVFWGLQEVRGADWADQGERIGEIPQVAHTYAYFHSAYSHINEHQLALSECTTSQRPELDFERGQGEQILTIEQAMVFVLQRCRRAVDALALLGRLMEDWGFLPSCGGGSELLVLADPLDAWVFEVLGVGPGWQRASGRPGALWAARRVAPDQTLVAANWSLLRDLDPADAEVRIGRGVREFAIARGWHPAEEPVLQWQRSFIPPVREWAISRLWLFYSQVAPTLKRWPQRQLGADLHQTQDAYGQALEPADFYPFSVRPERPLGRHELLAFHRNTFEGTVYDISAQPQWMLQDANGAWRRSELATPFPGPEWRRLLKLTSRRPVARHFGHYAALCQLRSDRPDDIAGVYWTMLDNPLVSPCLPMHLGVEQPHACWQVYDPEQFDEASARWCVDAVDNLMRLGYQRALPLVTKAREELEAAVVAEFEALDAVLRQEADQAQRQWRATEAAQRWMGQVPQRYRDLRAQLFVQLSNNRWT